MACAVPKTPTVADLIDKYTGTITKRYGRTKEATLATLKREIGCVKLSDLHAEVLRDFIDPLDKDGAGGVTIAAGLSFFGAVLTWTRAASRGPERDMGACALHADRGFQAQVSGA